MFKSHDQSIEDQNDADLFLSQSRKAERAVKRRHEEMIAAVEQRKAEALRQITEKAAWKRRYEEIVMVPWETTQIERPHCSLPGLPAGKHVCTPCFQGDVLVGNRTTQSHLQLCHANGVGL